MVTEARFAQALKAAVPMVVRLEPEVMVSLVMDVPLKAFAPMELTFAGMVSSSVSAVPRKTSSPIDIVQSSLGLKVTLVREEQL